MEAVGNHHEEPAHTHCNGCVLQLPGIFPAIVAGPYGVAAGQAILLAKFELAQAAVHGEGRDS